MSMLIRTNQWSWMDDALPLVVMLTISCLDMALLTIVKAAMNDGLRSIVYVVYHNILGTLILFPFYITHIIRKVDRPPLTSRILFRFFILGTIGTCLCEVLGYICVDYSSPTMISAISNLAPGVTFLIAVIFRMEKLNIRSHSSLAKLSGTMTAILGTMVFTLYQGPEIFHTILSTNSPDHRILSQPSNWILGSLIMVITLIIACISCVLQAATIKEYPDQQTMVFFSIFLGTIQCILVSPFLERNPSAWALPHKIGVTAIVFGAISAGVIRNHAVTWCLWKKGPTFVTMFSPVSIVIAMILGVTFLGDSVYLGRVIGAIIVVVGFYMVIWGQTKEKNKILVVMEDDLDVSNESTGSLAPLLSTRNESKCYFAQTTTVC